MAIARRIRDAALAAGIPQEDIYIDCLTLTASAQQEDVLATVQALHACKEELGVRTILGVSNISFGLPCRSYLNTTFLTMAMYAGLDLAIMNPSSEEMMAAVYAYNVLTTGTGRARSTLSGMPTGCPPPPHWCRPCRMPRPPRQQAKHRRPPAPMPL